MCQTDGECPGATVCLEVADWWNATALAPVNVSGAAAPTGCACSSWYGNAGEDCAGSDTATARYWLGSSVFNALLCCAVLGAAGADLAQLTWARLASPRDAVYVTLAQLVVGMACVVVLGLGRERARARAHGAGD